MGRYEEVQVVTTLNKILLVVLGIGIVTMLGAIGFKTYDLVEARSSIAEPAIQEAIADPIVPMDQGAPPQTEEIGESSPAIALPQVEDEPVLIAPPPENISNLPAVDRVTCLPSGTDRQVASVVDVVDTDRLSVSIGGETFSVKYLGIETGDLYQGVGEAALMANRSLIGQTITLVKHISEDDGDGNLLRYVFTEDAFINQSFLENGLATALPAHPDEACAEEFQVAEALARSQEIGTWEQLKPENWREWPIVPSISQNAVDIYLRNLGGDGANPESFSVVGDCLSLPDRLFRRVGASYFTLPTEMDHLQSTVDKFSQVWSRKPVTVVSGFVPASVFSSYFADPNLCGTHESPIFCEFRINNPSILFISIGTDQKPGSEADFEFYMRGIIEFSIEEGVLPIISTKADPTAEDFPLNQLMAKLYDIPLWNFWATVQHLPNTGLNPTTGIHLTAEANEIRRLSALQVLDAVLTAAGQ
jgi:endonuclease YncB( thermonuclease family)